MTSARAVVDAARAQEQIAKLMLERELQEHVRKLVKVLGGELYHTHDSRHSAKGWPDNAIWVPQRPTVLMLAELKRQDKDMDADQEWWAKTIRGCESVEFHLWRPMDWLTGEIERALR